MARRQRRECEAMEVLKVLNPIFHALITIRDIMSHLPANYVLIEARPKDLIRLFHS